MTFFGCLSFILFLFCFRTSDSVFGHITSEFINGNTFSIYFSRGAGSLESKVFELKKDTDDERRLIFTNHKMIKDLSDDIYGKYGFYIFLNDSVQFEVGHYKFHDWGEHDYSVEIQKRKNSYHVVFIADGPDYVREVKNYNLNGLPNGSCWTYFRNGKVSTYEQYKNGKLDGAQFIFYEDGKESNRHYWKNDSLIGQAN